LTSALTYGTDCSDELQLDSARKLTLRRLLTLENASMDKCFVSFFIAGALSAACSGGQAFTSGPADANGGGDSGSNGAIAGDAGMTGTSASGAGASGEGGSDASAGAGEATGGDGGGTGGSGGLAAGAGGIGIGTAGTGMGTAGNNAGSGGATSASCPIPAGYYKMITIDGAGCGDLNASVPACTTPSGALCRYNIKSEGGKSVSGAIAVQADGSFQSATIQEGSVQRSGCQGTVTKGVLTIVCGGADPSSDQYCSATLTRTALLCP
jgi:hypothetical protein